MSDIDGSESENEPQVNANATDNDTDEKKSSATEPSSTEMLYLGRQKSQSHRAKMFKPGQAVLWSQQSIAVEFDEMLKDLQEKKMDYDIAGGRSSDIEFMSDSADAHDNDDDNTQQGKQGTTPFGSGGGLGRLPDLASYSQMHSEFNKVKSVSEVKHEHSKAMKEKLDSLQDKISSFIKEVHNNIKSTQNKKLIAIYQSAYDFLEDIQQEIDTFDDDITANESKLNALEDSVQSAQQKYSALILKLQKSRSQERALKTETMQLKRQVQELSIANSELKLSALNSFPSNDDADESESEDVDNVGDVEQNWESVQMAYEQKTAVVKPMHVASSSKVKATKAKAVMRLRPAPDKTYRMNPNIDEKEHRYLYDEYRMDASGTCASSFWTAFGNEIGFFCMNRHG
eukprot:CAMPEP_0202712722 /NCGR_PEP_ID=MMETSP1385-20130828/44502_1 /ASSEMBLY_ACC=CAM_ASM_000861 /TAXON_ID=933848 /ORGANISM="Elphidium margaritaceum" /LENGTH=399 /DNA_ID=CAMNT_0049372833 /DNA_START=41 /DNA_END=1240 /DNA_ORIENTATION=-